MKKNIKLKKIKSILLSLVFVISVVLSTNCIYGADEAQNVGEIFDVKVSDKVYKESEQTTPAYLPYIKFVSDRMIIDKELEKSGISFANKAIEVNSYTKGMQIMFSSDSIRVNSNMNSGVLISNGDIVIDSEINNTMILISSGKITLTENAKIDDDLIIVGNELEVKGNVLGSILGTVTKVNISGTITKDLRVETNDISFTNNENVKGNIYLKTYNENLNIKDKYPSATIDLQKVERKNNFTFGSIISMLFTSLILAVVYIVVNKICKKNVFLEFTNRVKKNTTAVIISGILLLLASFPVIMILILLSVFGFSVIAMPVIIVYIAFLIVVYMLSIFILGSVVYSYIKEKYIKTGGTGTDLLGSFGTFLVLSVLTKIPFVGTYLAFFMYILSIGMVFSLVLKDKNKKEE